MSDRAILTKRVEKLLGFDGADDVLDHLLTIESESVRALRLMLYDYSISQLINRIWLCLHLQDLLDYLWQLLGSNGMDVKLFVADVGRFKLGDAISPDKVETLLPTGNSELPSRQLQDNYIEGKPLAIKLPKKPTVSKKPARGAKKPPASLPAIPAPKKVVAQKCLPTTINKVETGDRPPEKQEQVKKYHPTKGKATIICGCFGSLHKPLTNCLYCGRISCAREGYDFCAFCGLQVEQVMEKSSDAATLHKNRLLRFDREFARRTVIFDDQADYFSNQTSTWLTEDEKDEAKEIESDRQKVLHTRKKQTLDIAF